MIVTPDAASGQCDRCGKSFRLLNGIELKNGTVHQMCERCTDVYYSETG